MLRDRKAKGKKLLWDRSCCWELLCDNKTKYTDGINTYSDGAKLFLVIGTCNDLHLDMFFYPALYGLNTVAVQSVT